MGRGALYYYHIESKENLLSLIHDRVIELVLNSAERVRALDVDPTEKLRRLGCERIQIVAAFNNHVCVFLSNTGHSPLNEPLSSGKSVVATSRPLRRFSGRGRAGGVRSP